MKLVGNYLITDHQADAFNPPRIPFNSTNSTINDLLDVAFSGLANWDAKHFIHIAQHGYLYEHSAAFFPLYPMLIKLFKEHLLDNLFTSDPYLALVATGVVLNFLFFNIAAIYLTKLTLVLFNNQHQIARSTLILFCLNPANVFFTAVYTECLYAMLTFSSLYYLFSSQFFISVGLMFFSGLCRSNGGLNFGFLAYVVVKNHFGKYLVKSDLDKLEGFRFFREILRKCLIDFKHTFQLVIKLVSGLLFLLTPFAIYQWYIYLRFCQASDAEIPSQLVEFARDNQYRLFNDKEVKSEWCSYKLPISYSYIQSEYWNVGLFRYWRFRQIPNFMLAAPIVYIGFASVTSYFGRLPNRNRFYDLLGLVTVKHESEANAGFDMNRKLFPFGVHLIALLISSVFFMHVQVATRFICSSSPFIYWYLASMVVKGVNARTENQLDLSVTGILSNIGAFDVKLKFALYYFVTFSVVGTLLFCNFLPFT